MCEKSMIYMLRLERQNSRSVQGNPTVIGQNKSQHEEQFIEACFDELTTGGSDSDHVSQTKFAAFLIQYCRNNKDFRGPKCSNALFFFQDLPNEIQLEFLSHSENICPPDHFEIDDALLQDCLDKLNAEGGLFFVDSDRIPSLCTSTCDLLIDTDLLLNTFSHTEAPLATSQPNFPIAPTWSPLNVLKSQQPTISKNPDHGNESGLSGVGILGIVMTALFVMLFLIQCILLHLHKGKSRKNQLANDVIALREDESVVASEHSNELLSPSEQSANMGANFPSCKNRDHSMETSLTPTNDFDSQSATVFGLIRANPQGQKRSKSATAVSRFRSFSFDNTSKSHSNDSTAGFLYPHPLITENLSDGNPVHVRKRFHKKLAGSFPFDENDINLVTASSDNDVEGKMAPAIPTSHAEKENDAAARRNVQLKNMNLSGKPGDTTMTTEITQGFSERSSCLRVFRQT